MRLNPNLHLTYCTNIHRGSNWAETMASLSGHTLRVKAAVCPGEPFGLGLWLSDLASRELKEPTVLAQFKVWLEENNCYVFTLNGFPFSQFHGTRVKERVYLPDWTQPERLSYTNRLFDLLGQLLPEGVPGSVSTLPGSFKEFIHSPQQKSQIYENLWLCLDHIEQVSEKQGRNLRLAIEPEPLGLWETSSEMVDAFRALDQHRPKDSRLRKFLGVNYDTCHMAIEYEMPQDVISRFEKEGLSIAKIHLSSALQILPTKESRRWLERFVDETYLHQVIARTENGSLRRYMDLDLALAKSDADEEEWRVHFHVPLNACNLEQGQTTESHLLGLMDVLAAKPGLCPHLEIETYTWEVLPEELRSRSVVEQLAAEYLWCLGLLKKRGLAGRS